MSDEPTTETETTSGEDATPETNNAPVIAPDASTTPVTRDAALTGPMARTLSTPVGSRQGRGAVGAPSG